MRARFVLAGVLALGCGKAVMADPKPPFALGDTLAMQPFAPGAYSVQVVRAQSGTMGTQLRRVDETALLVLDLAPGGKATATRGWHHTGSGGSVEKYREQQAYRGTYAVKDGVATVTLAVDPAGHVWEGDPQLPRAASLELVCVAAKPAGHAQLPAGVTLLACRPSPAAQELAPLVADGIGPGAPVFLLGSGHGLRVDIGGKPPSARSGPPATLAASVPAAALTAKDW